MQIKYKNTNLDIYNKNIKIDYDINKNIDINSLRDNFNKSIGILSIEHNTLEYWLMRLSERNTLVHNLFLDICKIKLLESYKDKDLMVFTNNISLYLYFKNIADISFNDKLSFKSKLFLSVFKPYLQVIKLSLKKILFQVKYVNKSYKKNLTNFIVIQTWISDNNFKTNEFKDSYYGDLAQYLKDNEKKVITWPIFYNVKDEKRAISYLRNNQNDFLIIEDYLKFSDYIEAIKHFFVKRFLKLGTVKIDNSDFTSLFNCYQKKESVEMASLFYSFTKRLKENNSENITFIHHHENMISEKALILGVRKYLPNSKVIGYFHTTKPKNILCLEYASSDEYKIAPKPDLVIFNSNLNKEYFQIKYPEMRCKNGIAFKQLHLKNITTNKETKTDKVLVLFSGTENEIKLMFELLNNLSVEYNFIFRMHPMNRFDVQNYYKKSNYIVENETSLDSLMAKVFKVISTYSAVAVESALSGLNIGLVYNNKNLLINPFDDLCLKNYQLISNVDGLDKFLRGSLVKIEKQHIFNIEKEDYKIFLEEI